MNKWVNCDPIRLRIDRGGMGGGEKIKYYEYTDTFHDSGKSGHVAFDDFYTNDFLLLPDGSPSDRNGIFHYCVFGEYGYTSDGDSGFYGITRLKWDRFFLADEKINDPDGQAHTFMHELGHNLGLDADYLYQGPDWLWGAYPDFLEHEDYPSSMRYDDQTFGAYADFVGYCSLSGTTKVWNGGNSRYPDGYFQFDRNDWAKVDLTTIQSNR